MHELHVLTGPGGGSVAPISQVSVIRTPHVRFVCVQRVCVCMCVCVTGRFTCSNDEGSG